MIYLKELIKNPITRQDFVQALLKTYDAQIIITLLCEIKKGVDDDYDREIIKNAMDLCILDAIIELKIQAEAEAENNMTAAKRAAQDLLVKHFSEEKN